MATFILILTFYAGALASGDSVSLTTAEFTTQERCEAAGKAAQKEFATGVKPVRFVCVQK